MRPDDWFQRADEEARQRMCDLLRRAGYESGFPVAPWTRLTTNLFPTDRFVVSRAGKLAHYLDYEILPGAPRGYARTIHGDLVFDPPFWGTEHSLPVCRTCAERMSEHFAVTAAWTIKEGQPLTTDMFPHLRFVRMERGRVAHCTAYPNNWIGHCSTPHGFVGEGERFFGRERETKLCKACDAAMRKRLASEESTP